MNFLDNETVELARECGCDVQRVSMVVLIKIGSALVHAEEFLSNKGHELDLQTFHNLIQQEDVRKWMEQGTKMAFLPVKRH